MVSYLYMSNKSFCVIPFNYLTVDKLMLGLCPNDCKYFFSGR